MLIIVSKRDPWKLGFRNEAINADLVVCAWQLWIQWDTTICLNPKEVTPLTQTMLSKAYWSHCGQYQFDNH